VVQSPGNTFPFLSMRDLTCSNGSVPGGRVTGIAIATGEEIPMSAALADGFQPRT
jgi:hypothetical protein